MPSKVKKAHIGDAVRSFLAGDLTNKSSKAEGFVDAGSYRNQTFYNNSEYDIKKGQSAFIQSVNINNISFNDAQQKFINNEVIVNISGSISSIDTDVDRSKVFVCSTDCDKKTFYNTTKSVNDFNRVLFVLLYVPQSGNASVYCKQKDKNYIVCTEVEATHIIIGSSYGKTDSLVEFNNTGYVVCIACVVEYLKKTSDDNVFVVSNYSNWTQNQSRTSTISALYNNNLISISSPLSKPGDTIAAGKQLIVCKLSDNSYLLINAEC